MSRAVSSDGPEPRLKRFVTAKECAEVMAKTECSLAARELLHRTEPCTIPSRKSFVGEASLWKPQATAVVDGYCTCRGETTAFVARLENKSTDNRSK
jgi:hypothetical protein